MLQFLTSRWAGFAMKATALLGMVVLAVAVVTYFRVTQAREDFIPIKGVISEWQIDPFNADAQMMTLTWTFNDQSYQQSESSPLFRQLNYHKGDTVDLYVNPGDASESVLPDAEPFLAALAWRIGKVGITLLMIAIGVWALRRFSP